MASLLAGWQLQSPDATRCTVSHAACSCAHAWLELKRLFGVQRSFARPRVLERDSHRAVRTWLSVSRIMLSRRGGSRGVMCGSPPKSGPQDVRLQHQPQILVRLRGLLSSAAEAAQRRTRPCQQGQMLAETQHRTHLARKERRASGSLLLKAKPWKPLGERVDNMAWALTPEQHDLNPAWLTVVTQ